MSALILTLTPKPKKTGTTEKTEVLKNEEYTVTLHTDNTRPDDISLTINDSKHSFPLTVKQLSFKKRLYQPCEIVTVLQLYKGTYGGLIPRESVYAAFQEASVTLMEETSGTFIAQDYYVHEVIPRYYNSGNGTSMEITLKIFSKDKKLTLDKFCRTYTAKKLYQDLVLEMTADDKTNPSGNGSEQGNTPPSKTPKYNELIRKAEVKVATGNHLSFLHYTRKISNDKSETEEFIQPYLVQYNESYYDLIARVANRCGEFLYFEDGMLCLGLPYKHPANPARPTDEEGAERTDKQPRETNSQDGEEIKAKEITEYVSISFQDLAAGVVDVKDHYYNGTDSADTYTQEAFAHNTNVPLDDYITIFKQNSFSNFVDEWWGDWGTQVLEIINSILNSTSLSETLISWATAQGMSLVNTPSVVKTKNNSLNEEHVTSMPEDQKRPCVSDGKQDDKKDDKDDKNALYEASPFSTLIKQSDVKYKFQESLNTFFYEIVKRAEKHVSGQAVIVDFGVHYTALKLGDLVTITDLTNQQYVVVEMEGYNQVNGDRTASGYQATLLPVYTYTETTKSDSKATEATDSASKTTEATESTSKTTETTSKTEKDKTTTETKTLQLVCPPFNAVNRVRQSGPQRALIDANNDPEGLGRVRIRYPWQTSDSASSPWIRMATPFATGGGGIYFAPSAGDEVLVDYDNGNIERPYVVGVLFNGKAAAPGNGTRVISSANGHSIVLKDAKSGSGFFSGLWGGMTLLETIIPGISEAFKGSKDLGGGITFTDKYGIYSISMSSEGRKVSISSPFGNVSINAFTGISLSAPNGNINISGKNVTIKASNNLTITSGENIPDSNTQMLKMAPEEVMRRRKLKDHSASLFFSDISAAVKESSSNLKPTLQEAVEGIWDFAKYDSASFAVEKLFESVAADYVDLSLLRNIMEAVLRPTAGTMLIKSWRFLRLEAGRGTTRIPNNAYTTSGLQRVLGDDHSSMKVTYETIMALSNMVDNWISSILTKHRKAYLARKDLAKLLKDYTLTKKEDQGVRSDADIKKHIDDLIKDALTSTIVTSASKEDFVFKETGPADNRVPLPKGTQEFITNCATYLRKTVSEHRKLIEDYTKSLSGYQISSLLRRSLMKGTKSPTGNQQIEFKLDAFTSVTNGTETYEQEPMEVEPFMAQQQGWIQATKRKLIFRYINNYSNLISSAGITANEESSTIQSQAWTGFVEALHTRGKEDPDNSDNDWLNKTVMSAINTATDSLLDSIAFPDWSKSKDLWGPESEGEILFSDKSGHTLNFEHGHLNHTVNSDRADDYLLRIKLKLKSI